MYFDLLQDLNKQTDKIVNDLREAKRIASTTEDAAEREYNRGRAEELEKWWKSNEALIERICSERIARAKEQLVQEEIARRAAK